MFRGLQRGIAKFPSPGDENEAFSCRPNPSASYARCGFGGEHATDIDVYRYFQYRPALLFGIHYEVCIDLETGTESADRGRHETLVAF